MFASWIPEITELAAQRSKYGGTYNKDPRKRYTPTIQNQTNKQKNPPPNLKKIYQKNKKTNMQLYRLFLSNSKKYILKKSHQFSIKKN